MKMFLLAMVLIGWVQAGIRAQGNVRLPIRLPDTLPSYPLEVAERFTTNLLFPYPVVTVDLGTGDVLARKLGRALNVLLLKANRPHFAATNVSVYLGDGSLYSFCVRYADSPAQWNYRFSSGGPAPVLLAAGENLRELDSTAARVITAPAFLRVGATAGKVGLMLKRVYYENGLLWLGFSARNRSLIPFTPSLLRFSVEDRKRVRRMAMQSIPLEPAYACFVESLPGGMRTRFAVGIPPFTISHRKILLVEWAEAGNGRRILLRVKGKDILKARKLSEEH